MQQGHSICFCLVIYLFICWLFPLGPCSRGSQEFVLFERDKKSVQHIHLMARSYWLAPKNQYRWSLFPLSLFLFLALGFSSEPRICWCFAFKKELQHSTWFQLWKWKAIASVWCFSILVYRHIKHKEGKRRKKGGSRGGAVKGFATTTSIQTIILVACGCCEFFSAEFALIKEPDWLKHTFLCISVYSRLRNLY